MYQSLSNTIDVVLGFVTIVLVLSLIIQSVQNLIKTVLRMKSRQAEQSLKMLFDYVLTHDETKYAKLRHASPILSAAASIVGREEGTSPGDQLIKFVKGELLEMGRKSFWGNAMMDSFTKGDLMQILSSLETDDAKLMGIDVEALKKALPGAPSFEESLKKTIDEKVKELEGWYDTVMPGIAERHVRGMRWMAMGLSAIVVVMLNANAIRIYDYVKSDPGVQQTLSKYAEDQLSQLEASKAKQNPAELTAPPDVSRTQSNATLTPSGPGSPAPPSATPSSGTVTTRDLKPEIDAIRQNYAAYRSFGLSPFKCEKCFDDTKSASKTLAGWVIMTLLLSLGAPFWEDALGSLFGLKNALRKKDTTKSDNG